MLSGAGDAATLLPRRVAAAVGGAAAVAVFSRGDDDDSAVALVLRVRGERGSLSQAALWMVRAEETGLWTVKAEETGLWTAKAEETGLLDEEMRIAGKIMQLMKRKKRMSMQAIERAVGGEAKRVVESLLEKEYVTRDPKNACMIVLWGVCWCV